LNDILILEELEVVLDGISPIITNKKANFNFNVGVVEPKTSEVIEPNFAQFNFPNKKLKILTNRWLEFVVCFNGNASLCAIVSLGSILEAILLCIMKQFMQEVNTAKNAPKTKDGKVKFFRDWSFNQMIEVGHELNWLNYDVKSFSHALRDYRNLIHPEKQFELEEFPDIDTVHICLNVFYAAINDLSKLFNIKV